MKHPSDLDSVEKPLSPAEMKKRDWLRVPTRKSGFSFLYSYQFFVRTYFMVKASTEPTFSMIIRNDEVFFSHQAIPKARSSFQVTVGFWRQGMALSNSVSVSECSAQIICDGERPLKTNDYSHHKVKLVITLSLAKLLFTSELAL